MMTGSKESCQEAMALMESVALDLDAAIKDATARDDIKRKLLRVHEFLEQAAARLPSLPAIKRDKPPPRKKMS